jgi:4-hydroxybenzoate polyprenyltransferase
VRRILGLAQACHPEACATVTLVATLLAIAANRTPTTALLIATAVLTGQLCVGWLNDFLDAPRDTATNRTDKPIPAGRTTKLAAAGAAGLAGVACVPLSLSVGVLPGALHLTAVACALAYDLGLKSTALSAVPYLISFGLLPVFVVLGHAPVSWWLPTAGALLGAAAHFANVLPDLAADAATGVRGLPHRIGRKGSTTATVALLVAASVVLAVGPSGQVTLRLILTGVALLVLVLARRHLFRAVMAVAVLDVIQLVVATHG